MKHSGSYDRERTNAVRNMLPKLNDAGALQFT